MSTEGADRDALYRHHVARLQNCAYRTPFHTAQLGLFGLDDEQIKEAGWVVQNATGASAYLYGVGYDQETFREELDRLVEFRKKAHEM